jgi:hypothetical protein
MGQPVWTLSVDLQTKTAVFQSGMSDAAKAARGSFQEIKEGANEMGRATGGSMMEARHGVMLLGEEFGVHLPRALTSFIASIGPVGAAMEAAFPFLAIIVGATLLLEHLSKLKEAGAKLTESQANFGTTVANVLNSLDTKLIEAGIQADELNHNHLGALQGRLELIDRQSMEELVKSFGIVAKAADVTFAQLKTSFYQWGVGSDGAKASLERFKVAYDSLLAQQNEGGATALLDSTIEREEKILDLKKQANASQAHSDRGGQKGDYLKFEEAKLGLQKMGMDLDKVDLASQQKLVDTLHAQAEVQAKVNELKTAQGHNAGRVTQDKTDGDGDKAAREQAQAQKQAADEASKLWEENYRRAVSALQENEREKIDATKEGSEARLAAIDAAIKEENGKGLQDTAFYRGLLTARVNLTREMAAEQAKLSAEAGKQEAEHALKMGGLVVQAEKQAAALRMSVKRVTDQERMSSEIKLADEEHKLQSNANAAEIAALDKGGKDYENKLKALQDKQTEMTRAHENLITQIRNTAEEDRNRRILAASTRFNEDFSKGLASVAMRHESMAKMVMSLGNQMVQGMIANAIQSILVDDMTKEHDAAKAAREAYKTGWKFPYPANIVAAPAMGAMAFATTMAFASGGLVPGSGNGDTVPAMLTPGEAVLPKALTEGLSNAARNGNLGGGGGDVHVHNHFSPQVHAMDSDGVDRVLKEHGDKFAAHAEHHIRKMNR